MAQLPIDPNGIDIATPYQYRSGGAPYDPDWPKIASDGIRWCSHKVTEGKGYTDPNFARFMQEANGILRYRGGYAWPRTDSGPFYDQVMRTVDLVHSQPGIGKFVMVDVETTSGIRSWSDVEVTTGMDRAIAAAGPILLYGRIVGGYDYCYANWTAAPNVPGTVVRQLGGGFVNGVSSRSDLGGFPTSVDIDVIVDQARMDIIAGYTPTVNGEAMWIANCDGDLFLVGTSVLAITSWSVDHNPDVLALTNGQSVWDVALQPDLNTKSRIRAMALAAEGTVTVAAGTVTATVDTVAIAKATRAEFVTNPLSIQIAGAADIKLGGNAK